MYPILPEYLLTSKNLLKWVLTDARLYEEWSNAVYLRALDLNLDIFIKPKHWTVDILDMQKFYSTVKNIFFMLCVSFHTLQKNIFFSRKHISRTDTSLSQFLGCGLSGGVGRSVGLALLRVSRSRHACHQSHQSQQSDRSPAPTCVSCLLGSGPGRG